MFEKQLKSPLRSPLMRAILAGNSTQYMIEGYNLATNNSYTGGTLFSNVCYQMGRFERFSGVGAWTQDQGTVSAAVGTDEFRAKISEAPATLPAGTYTVYNPTGANISFGTFAAPGAHSGGYSTATSFTFTYTSGMLALFVKGSLTCTGFADALKVILPGHTTSWAAGNVWNSDYLTFRAGLGGGVLRMMDWNNASGSIEEAWSDRTTTAKVSLVSNIVGSQVIPYELCIDLANRLGADPWLCLPHRSTSDYVAQFGTLVAATLSPGRRLWVEHGNEVWNYGGAWAEGTNWVDFLSFTKYTATANYATDTYTLNSHGLTNGAVIRAFTTKENNISYNSAGGTAVTYHVSRGTDCVVYAATANTFRLYRSDGVTAHPIADSQVNLLYCKAVEAGKSAAMNTRYGELCLRNWDILDPILGVNNYNRMVVRQVANTSTLAGALAVTGGDGRTVASRATYISGAPYFAELWWFGKADIASGQLTLGAWVSRDTHTVHASVYAAGAAPTEAEIIAGTGAISHQSTSVTYASSSAWTALPAVTGLSNGTSYKVYFLLVDTERNYVLSDTVTVSATTSTTVFYDSAANQSLRLRKGTKHSVVVAQAFMAAAPTIPLFCYEGGLHNHETGPTEALAWLTGTYQESPEFAAVMLDYLYRMAAAGVKGHAYYAEMTGSTNVFSIADGVTDTADLRYAALSGLSGRVAVQPSLSITNTTPVAIPSLPSLPYVIETLPAEAGRTYTIIGGNSSGNLDISGNNLRLISATGIDWGTPVNNTVYLEALRDGMSDQFMLSFFTGNSWYESDAKFAWSTITDTDTAAINPIRGGTVALTSGTAAVAGGGLWDLQTNSYYYNGTTAVATNLPQSGTPMLFAMVMDKDNHVANFTVIAGFGTTPYLQFTTDGSALYGKIYTGSAAHSVSFGNVTSLPTGAHVYWIYMDGAGSPTMYVGRDQNDVGNIGSPSSSGQTFGKGLQIGNTSGMLAKIGSVEVVSRAGMTRADAKAIVAKMQAHHGIA